MATALDRAVCNTEGVAHHPPIRPTLTRTTSPQIQTDPNPNASRQPAKAPRPVAASTQH